MTDENHLEDHDINWEFNEDALLQIVLGSFYNSKKFEQLNVVKPAPYNHPEKQNFDYLVVPHLFRKMEADLFKTVIFIYRLLTGDFKTFFTKQNKPRGLRALLSFGISKQAK